MDFEQIKSTNRTRQTLTNIVGQFHMRTDKMQKFQIKNPVKIHLLLQNIIVKLLTNTKSGTIGLICF